MTRRESLGDSFSLIALAFAVLDLTGSATVPTLAVSAPSVRRLEARLPTPAGSAATV